MQATVKPVHNGWAGRRRRIACEPAPSAPAAARQPGPLRLIQVIDAQGADLRGAQKQRVCPTGFVAGACRRQAGGGWAAKDSGSSAGSVPPPAEHCRIRWQGVRGQQGALGAPVASGQQPSPRCELTASSSSGTCREGAMVATGEPGNRGACSSSQDAAAGPSAPRGGLRSPAGSLARGRTPRLQVKSASGGAGARQAPADPLGGQQRRELALDGCCTFQALNAPPRRAPRQRRAPSRALPRPRAAWTPSGLPPCFITLCWC